MSSLRRFFVVRLRAVLFVPLAALAIAQAPSASARTINGCEIVPNPTVGRHTNCPSADLNRADLYGLNLRFANLSDADLSHANLSETNLSHADLSDASLFHAKLIGASLTESADLHRANLHGAVLHGADMSSANLSSANMSSADLSSADLASADVSGADLSDAVFCGTIMPDETLNNKGCASGAKPPEARSRAFVLPASTTKTFDIGYPLALKYKRAQYFCDAVVSGPGKRYVKILSRGSAQGGTICRVRARNTAKRGGRNTTAMIKVVATTSR